MIMLKYQIAHGHDAAVNRLSDEEQDAKAVLQRAEQVVVFVKRLTPSVL